MNISACTAVKHGKWETLTLNSIIILFYSAMIAEAYSPVEVLSTYINNGTHVGSQVPMNFNFIPLNNQVTAEHVEYMAKNWMDVMWTRHKMANWVVGNHDNSRPATRLGWQRRDIMTIIAHALPGTSVTYYVSILINILFSNTYIYIYIYIVYKTPIRTFF